MRGNIVVYDKRCRIGGTPTLDDFAATEVGDWKMPAFRAACAYAASQDWLIVADEVLTLTTAGLGARLSTQPEAECRGRLQFEGCGLAGWAAGESGEGIMR